MKYTADVLARFWAFVDKTESCWLWRGRGEGHSNPYGTLWVKGKILRAHRMSWEIHHGPIPEGEDVLHTCDVPNCINPDHLFLGNNLVNVYDCIFKGRHTHQKPNFAARGEDHGSSKLSVKQVFQIRRLSLKGVSGRRIAKWLGMSSRTIWKLLNGITWAEVPFPINTTDTLELHQY